MTAGNGAAPLGEAEYAELVERIHAAVAASVPPGASVLVLSKGDAALLAMPTFPRTKQATTPATILATAPPRPRSWSDCVATGPNTW
jgi:hypothetical protein